MTILQSLVESDPNSKNIKELVELLKKVSNLPFRQLNTSPWRQTRDSISIWSSSRTLWPMSSCRSYWNRNRLLTLVNHQRKSMKVSQTLYDGVCLTFLNTYLHQGLLYPSEVSWFFLNLNEGEIFSPKDWSADFFEKNKLKKITGRLNLLLWLYGQTRGEYNYENCEKLNKINKILHIWLADSFRRL